MAPVKGPGGNGLPFLLGVACLAGLGYGGWTVYRVMFVGAHRARIENISLYNEIVSQSPSSRVDLILNFKEPPKGDLKDVKLRLSGEPLREEQTFDWAWIAEHDRQKESTPDADPPFGIPLDLRIQIRGFLKSQMEIGGLHDFALWARLEWAGQPQDKTSVNVMSFYNLERH